ncbi:MAG: hypothetical protein U1G07_14680 [Verrucomicrobiota bacterium]
MTSHFSINAFGQALGWALIHFLWQGAFVALLLKAVLIGIRGRPPRARYILLCAGLSLMALCPVATCVVLVNRVAPAMARSGMALPEARVAVVTRDLPAGPSNGLIVEASRRPSGLDAFRSGVESKLPWVVRAWALGVLLLSLRLVLGTIEVRRLGRSGQKQLKPLRNWNHGWTMSFRRGGYRQKYSCSRPILSRFPPRSAG